ncbi:MAG: IS200/IS605 family transposase [Nanoarchaeota archaeon]|nr:IS200/IS605 family transposase [Nanoarchaeota archaeon]
MEKELILSSNAIGESNFHIQLTPAFRRQIFRDEQVAELTFACILEKLNELKVVLVAYNFGPDHLHLFVANVRFVSEIELVRQIKGYSSFKMRRHFSSLFKNKLWGNKFWSGGHFYRSVGAVNKETMKHYIEDCQDKHWERASAPKLVEDMQKRIVDFST